MELFSLSLFNWLCSHFLSSINCEFFLLVISTEKSGSIWKRSFRSRVETIGLEKNEEQGKVNLTSPQTFFFRQPQFNFSLSLTSFNPHHPLISLLTNHIFSSLSLKVSEWPPLMSWAIIHLQMTVICSLIIFPSHSSFSISFFSHFFLSNHSFALSFSNYFIVDY